MAGRRRRQDHFAKRAQRENFPARSVYKLKEIDKRVSLIRRGDAVLDLGAAPGSWALYAAEKVGPSGTVVAVDRAKIDTAFPSNVHVLEGDALAVEPADLLALIGRPGFDLVISDMAPRTSGHRFVDQSRSFNLFMRALEIAAQASRAGGRFVGKIFQGEDFETARERVKELYATARVLRPESVRKESFEVYLVGLARR